MITLTRDRVRTLMLAALGLHSPPTSPATKNDISTTIQKMGYLQIDSIQAVRRSQYLVLWSRLGAYDVDWLGQLQTEGKLFEYYAHGICYLPIEDYPVFRGMILNHDGTGNGWQKWAEEHQDIVERVLNVVRKSGPIASTDFVSETISTGWGNVKRERLALNRLFSSGALMVSHRDKFRRYFDLRERILPNWDDAEAMDYETARETLMLKAIHALGIAREDWIPQYYYLPKSGISEALAEWVADGKLHQVNVEGWEAPAYVHPDRWEMVTAREDQNSTHTTFLSPFDPLVSDRDRAMDVFGFDYKMESYTPVKDRQYGYFCTPILHKGRLVGRLDPKAHRKARRMEIKKIFLEPGVEINDELLGDLKACLLKFTDWHGMEALEITAADPPELREGLL